jgi:hypothetical protein
MDSLMTKAAILGAGSTALVLAVFTASADSAYAQAGSKYAPAGSYTDTGESAESVPTEPPAGATSIAPSSNPAESYLFYFLNVSGRTQADFEPLTASEKARFYAKGLLSPFHFLTAAASAGVAQWEDVPPAWGQEAGGYARRFGNYVAKQVTQRTLRLAGEELLHEDNRYFASGERGFGRRVLYAIERSVLARKDDGTSRISISQIGSTAGAAFISRLWQPATNGSAGDGAVSFGFGMAANAGINVVREFMPDVTKHLFRHSPAD